MLRGNDFHVIKQLLLGEFKDNMMHGTGTTDFPDRSQYKGDWRRDKRVGRGILRLANGDRYE